MPKMVRIPTNPEVSWERLNPEGTRFSPLSMVLWGPLVLTGKGLRTRAVVTKRAIYTGGLEATIIVHTYISDWAKPNRSTTFTLHLQVQKLNPAMALLRTDPKEALLFDKDGVWVPFLTCRSDEGAKVVFLDRWFKPYWRGNYSHLGLLFEDGRCSWPKWVVYLWQRVTIWRWHLEHQKIG